MTGEEDGGVTRDDDEAHAELYELLAEEIAEQELAALVEPAGAPLARRQRPG